MSLDTEATLTVEKYAKIIDFATAKTYRKWRAYLEARGNSAGFEREDIRQLAVEAVLLLAGLLPGRKHSIAGKLAEIESRGGERWLQRSVDMYVTCYVAKMAENARAVKRESNDPVYLDATLTEGYYESSLTDVNDVALPDIATRFPVLYALEIEGFSTPEVMERLGLTKHQYQTVKAREVRAFTDWAHANRRVERDAVPRFCTVTPEERKRFRRAEKVDALAA